MLPSSAHKWFPVCWFFCPPLPPKYSKILKDWIREGSRACKEGIFSPQCLPCQESPDSVLKIFADFLLTKVKTTVDAGTSFLSPCLSLGPRFLASAQMLEHKLRMSKHSELTTPNTLLHIHPSSSPLPLSQWVPARTLLYTPGHSFFFFLLKYSWFMTLC